MSQDTGSIVLLRATRALTEAGVPEASGDARRLFAHALGLAAGRLTLALPEPVSTEAQQSFDALIERRLKREPVSHLTGKRMFYSRDFIVSSEVLDPRPETETLIEAALSQPFERVLDLGTGSGCILLTLLAEMTGCFGVGADISPAALSVARANAAAFGLSARAELVISDWFEKVTGSFDLICANPPYLAPSEISSLAPEIRDWEPRAALTDGSADGLGAYRNICANAARHLIPGGRLLLEIGEGQGPAVMLLVEQAGFKAPIIVPDLDGRGRVVAGVLPSPFDV
ncbi:MAG: peptide chain release factor N(5)-glutamine methyltransferase [Rhodobacteraceae bacterium]|nr:peptide chain release factor N(5)-glutamine methyltransferase [Paracoccaceae bacterium]